MDDIRVSILGRNEIFREGLKRILLDQEFIVGHSVIDADELLSSKGKEDDPHLIVIDSRPDPEVLEMCRILHESYPLSHIVLMTDEYTVESVGQALDAGVDGYLVNAISCEPLGGALRLVALGEKVIPSQIVQSLFNPGWRVAPSHWEAGKIELNLSDREIEILRCLVSGDANKIIARRLDITEATVKVHIKAILRKLHVLNRTQAAIWAVTRGLDRDEPAKLGQICEFPTQEEIRARAVISY